MSYRRLWFFVEGPDDERFVKNVLAPKLRTDFDHIQTWMYAGETKEKIRRFLQSIQSIGGKMCYLVDINSNPCITAKKKSVALKYDPLLKAENVFIAVQEIESWYAAGIEDHRCEKLDMNPVIRTDNLTKEGFNRMIPHKFQESRTDFMIEILKDYSVEAAKNKNRSFNYFIAVQDKFGKQKDCSLQP